MAELKRILNLKRISLLMVLVIVNLVLFFYDSLDGKSVDEYIRDNKTYVQALEKYADYMKLAPENIKESEVRKHILYLQSYESDVDAVIANAEKLKKYSIFSKAGTFAYSNVLQTGSDFERVDDVRLPLDNDRGVGALANYYYVYYIAMGFMLLIVYELFKERDNGVWKLTYSAAGGRSLLAIKRLGVLAITSAITLTALYFSTFVGSMIVHGGWSDLSSPVQTIESFAKFTYPLSKIEYVFVLFTVSWFALFGVSVMIWCAFSLFRKRNHALVLAMLFVGVEAYVYDKISVLSAYNALRYINIVNLLRINEMLCTYLNWGFGTYVFPVASIVIFSLLIASAIAAVVAVEAGEDVRTEGKTTKLDRLIEWINGCYQKVFAKVPVIVKEFHKLVITGKAVWVIVAVILVTVYFSGNGRMTFTDNQIELDKMYLEHGGADYSYMQDYISEMMADINALSARQIELAEASRRGETIDIQEYMSVMHTLSILNSKLAGVEEVSQKITAASSIKEKYDVDVWLVSDRGYEEMFGRYSTQRELILLIALVTGIMLIICESIALEYRTGMNLMLRASANGRSWLTLQKIAMCMLFTTLMTAVVYAIDMATLVDMYGIAHTDAPALSLTLVQESMGKGALALPFMQDMIVGMSIAGLMVVRLIIRWGIALLTMAIAIVLSNVMKKGKNRGIAIIAVVVEIILLIPFVSWLGVL